MIAHSRKVHRPLVVLLTLLLCLASVAAAPAGITWPERLVGDRGGAFAFYPIDYPGGGRVMTLELQFTPADPVAVTGAGFNLYGPNGYFIGKAKLITTKGGVGVARLAWAESKPASWQVQVYNYLPGTEVAYTLLVDGVQYAPAAESTEKDQSSAAASAQPLPATASGLLTGNRGGTYAFRELYVAEGTGSLQVTLNWWPDDAAISRGVGMVIYGPAGEEIRGEHAAYAGEASASLSRSKPGRYLVQVYNYMDNLLVGWVLKTSVVN
jgi:hypothetical protein